MILAVIRGMIEIEIMGIFLWADPRTSCFVDKEIFIGANGILISVMLLS